MTNRRSMLSGKGSIQTVVASGDGTEITVAGTAVAGVEDVLVMISPLDSEEQLWVGETKVFAQEWKMVIATEPKLAREYEIKVRYFTPSGVTLASNQRVLASSLEDPPVPPPPAPPSQIVDCVVVHGDSCFQNQPGWSDPSIYRSDQ